MLSFITCLLLMISLNIYISISNGIPTLTVQISMKTDPYSALDKPQKHTLRGRTSSRSFTLSALKHLECSYKKRIILMIENIHKCCDSRENLQFIIISIFYKAVTVEKISIHNKYNYSFLYTE